MTNEGPARPGIEFIQACCMAQNQFDVWVESLSEADLKKHFRRLVEIRSSLNEALREAKTVLDLEQMD